MVYDGRLRYFREMPLARQTFSEFYLRSRAPIRAIVYPDKSIVMEKKNLPPAITVALISALASVIVALISSGLFVRSVDVESTWKEQFPNVAYKSSSGGIVIAMISASSEHRSVMVSGYVDGKLVAMTGAQDSTNPGSPSIGASTITMPVPKDSEWIIKTPDEQKGQVKIQWFTSTLR